MDLGCSNKKRQILCIREGCKTYLVEGSELGVYTDPETGVNYTVVKGQILVAFEENVTEEQIQKISQFLEKNGGRFVGQLAYLGIGQALIPKDKNPFEIADQIEELPGVLYATPNIVEDLEI